ncbi:MAG: hypothetical protein A2149_08930 [Candidatus Schekmanbacteria bacterium RBG_16_38_11]|uniref:histidine kinase n=1 Tax=Candidatus Schekmanbacteria bacterium RBG_16_38_11 TaxID=1817880 RepID=A0A1F7RYM5_9BACT|nr:MAG: hypothetical protein A2149_08930 [Candidatus Schekmanbacteria bacterium RBG_16_38_11]
MVKITIFWRTVLLFCAYLFLVNGTMMLFYILTESPGSLSSEMQKAITSDASTVTKKIEKEMKYKSITEEIKNPADFQELKTVMEKEKRDMQILDLSGNVISEIRLENGIRRKKLTENDIKIIQTKGLLMSKGYAGLIRSTVEIIMPLKIDGKILGFVQISYPKTNPLRLKKVITFAVVVETIIVALLAMLFSKWFAIPIGELIKATEQMAKGNLGYQAKIKSSDEIGELANTFNYMSKSLADMTKVRGELTADISHELRSPLSRIRACAESLADRVIDDEKDKESYLQAICEEVDDLNSLIGDLLELSKLELDKVNLERSLVSPKEIINSVVSKITPIAKRKGVTVEVDIENGIPDLPLDGRRISRVIGNLVDNSLKYTNSHGRIKVTAVEKGDCVEINVEDNGRGIPQEELQFIFERFYRIDKSRARDTGGTGLGLAIAKQIIKAHGGEITAQSKLGEGTKVTFYLPKKAKG